MTYRALLAAYLGPQWPGVSSMAGLLLAGTALQLIGPQVVRGFLDAAQRGAGEEDLRRAALLFLALSFLQQGARVLAGYWSERVAWTATNALRADLAAHLLGLDLGFHKARTPGELIERVDGDVGALAGFFSGFTVQLAGSALLLLGIVGAVSLVDLRLGLAFGLFAGAAVALLGWVRRAGTPAWRDDREQSAAHYGLLGEVLSATEDLRASGAVPYAMGRFFARLRAWWPVRRRAASWEQGVMMAAIVAFAFADAVAYGLGGALHQAGAISLGTVYVVVAYAAMLAAPIETLRTQLQDLQKADAALGRVRDLLATRSRLRGTRPGLAASPSLPLPDGPLSVELRGVRFWYDDEPAGGARPVDDGAGAGGRAPVLDDVSFSLAPGRVLGLIGRTGSGKSTVARLLFRFYDPPVGEVRLGGVDVRDVGLGALRSRVGLVTQDVQLFTATLRDNLTFFDPTVADERLLAVLADLGLGAWLARLPAGLDTEIAGDRLSAGEAQLVALARVFLRDPGLVILDEPSSRLDPSTRALLERAVDRLLGRRDGRPTDGGGAGAGCTAVIVAHQLSTLERADDVLLLERGRVLERGARGALAADPLSRLARLLRTGAADPADPADPEMLA
jgi:ABC-type multidrug transport system fused ATPase/permease subunit